VLALPGIGRYTAGAICSIAFNQPTPILDGNVIRVLTRLCGIKGDPREKKTNAKLWQIAEYLVNSAQYQNRSSRRKEAHFTFDRQDQSLLTSAATTENNCSHFNQSLMELGALICTPKNPRCSDCPLKSDCVAHRKQLVHLLPNIPRRAPATSRRFFAFVINRNSRFLVRQRPADVVNAHLWEFPNIEINGETDIHKIAETALGFHPQSLEPARTIKHTITRYRITLDVFRGLAEGRSSHLRSSRRKEAQSFYSPSRPEPKVPSGSRWLKLHDLHTLPFSSAHKKILADL
jgi:A/G-specific adenine glycosylase